MNSTRATSAAQLATLSQPGMVARSVVCPLDVVPGGAGDDPDPVADAPLIVVILSGCGHGRPRTKVPGPKNTSNPDDSRKDDDKKDTDNETEDEKEDESDKSDEDTKDE
jgi:hypothetical protein